MDKWTPKIFWNKPDEEGNKKSERKERKEFLPWDKFVLEVRRASEGKEIESVSDWYEKEYKKHKGWPSNPNITFKDKGWVGFFELIGKEKGNKWYSIDKMVRVFNVSRKTIESKLAEFENELGGNSKDQKSKGKLVKVYSPKIFSKLNDFFSKWELPPQDWENADQLRKKAGIAHDFAQKLLEKFVQKNGQQHERMYRSRTRFTKYYSPEAINFILKRLEKNQIPKGWLTVSGISNQLNIGVDLVKKHIDVFLDRKNDVEKFCLTVKPWSDESYELKYYSPEVILYIHEQSKSMEHAPDGWLTYDALINKFHIGQERFNTLLSEYIEKYGSSGVRKFWSKNNSLYTYYSPEIIDFFEKNIFLNESSLNGFLNIGQISKKLKLNYSMVQNSVLKFLKTHSSENHVKKFHLKGEDVDIEYFSPDIFSFVKKDLDDFINSKEREDGWMTVGGILKYIRANDISRISHQTIEKTLKDYVTKNGESNVKKAKGKNGLKIYYSPSAAQETIKRISETEFAPKGWKSLKSLIQIVKSGRKTIFNFFNNYIREHKEYEGHIKNYKSNSGNLGIHYSPELVEVITLAFKDKMDESKNNRERLILEEELSDFLSKFSAYIKGEEVELTQEEKEIIEKIKLAIEVFGGSKALDILYKFYPRFKGVPVEYIKSELGSYLGEFMLEKTRTRMFDLEKILPLLENTEFKQALFLPIKEKILSEIHSQLKSGGSREENITIVDELCDEYKEFYSQKERGEDFVEVLEQVRTYFWEVFTSINFKDRKTVTSLKGDRYFPDINQEINIHELATKKRILIADEMGMGKSASAILAKEFLNIKTAVILCPANVRDTWMEYLSDIVNEKGEQKGYFQKGMVPRVKKIERNIKSELDDLRINGSNYDYIIISHESLNDEVGEVLASLPSDMLIVDEVHKLKNIKEGERADVVKKLSEKLEERNGYLCLLSGTPVPNTVDDVAMLLKLLHPSMFKDTSDNSLVASILKGNVLDIRSLLQSRMEKKEIRGTLQMPELQKITVYEELTPKEKDIYELILEDDDLTAMQKINTLRKFLLTTENKMKGLKNRLMESLKEGENTVVFVTGFVEGILDDTGVLVQNMDLGNAKVEVIHGDISKDERERIKKRLKEENNVVVFVSGQTADVGVDFSGAQNVEMYNLPWTYDDASQQIGRVFRYGQNENVKVVKSIVRGTLEQGIDDYVRLKKDAVQKVVEGIPLSELDEEMAQGGKNIKTIEIVGDEKLAEEYIQSPANELNKMFFLTKDLPHEKQLEFYRQHGAEYADSYQKRLDVFYQANLSRVTNQIIREICADDELEDPIIFDLASGPEMLRRYSSDEQRGNIFSTDINKYHFNYLKPWERTDFVSSILDLPLPNGIADIANMSLAIQDLPYSPSRNVYERLRAIFEMSEILKINGIGIISFAEANEWKNLEELREVLGILGLEIIDNYTGKVDSDCMTANMLVFRKVEDQLEEIENADEKFEKIKELCMDLGEGLKFIKAKRTERSKKGIIDNFTLNGAEYEIESIEYDELLKKEMIDYKQDMKDLIIKYGGLDKIPQKELDNRNILKVPSGKRWKYQRKSKINNSFIELL